MNSKTDNEKAGVNDSDALFVDIGANLLDPMYSGEYRGKPRHTGDLDSVLQRAWSNKLDRIIITGGTLEESRKGLNLSKTDSRLFCTVGVHPTRCSSEFGKTEESWNEYLSKMEEVVEEGGGHVVAIGELGLDYARLEFCDIETQKKGFIAQLQLAKKLNLPLFLHNRETGNDLYDILKEYYFMDNLPQPGGVVHSFDDTLDLAEKFLELGLYIGINGCSLKTQRNLDVVKKLPMDRLLLETDCPWCDIRASHSGYEYITTKFPTKTEKKYEEGHCVKGRYEPCHITQVAEVIAGVKGLSVADVAKKSRENAFKLFGGLQKS